MNRIITISREFGSGGRTVGRKTAEQLNIPCYDAELIRSFSEESGYTPEFIEEQGERVSSRWIQPVFYDRSSGLTEQDKLWNIQRAVILKIAEQGPCVIVGRCADYILKGRADCLNAFIHASPVFRAERIVKVYGEREESPAQRVRTKDKQRAAYHRFYTDMKWGYAQNYDICLDSERLGIDRCADILASLY